MQHKAELIKCTHVRLFTFLPPTYLVITCHHSGTAVADNVSQKVYMQQAANTKAMAQGLADAKPSHRNTRYARAR